MGFVTWGARERERLRAAGRVAAATLETIGSRIRPGITTADIDAWVREDTAARGAAPSQLGYHGFPAAVCTSVNDVVCHGIPSRTRVLAEGDIVNVDVTSHLGGFHGDTSATFFVGTPTESVRRLVETARACRDAGIAVARHGAHLGDVGAAIEEVARAAGTSVVRDFGGHGIGREMHTAPHVSHVGRRGTGPRLVAGMAITIEPMINLGRPDVLMLGGEWNVVTADGSWSAQFEHTILIERGGAEILTLSSTA
jgi:methionyl aminopeptidase